MRLTSNSVFATDCLSFFSSDAILPCNSAVSRSPVSRPCLARCSTSCALASSTWSCATRSVLAFASSCDLAFRFRSKESSSRSPFASFLHCSSPRVDSLRPTASSATFALSSSDCATSNCSLDAPEAMRFFNSASRLSRISTFSSSSSFCLSDSSKASVAVSRAFWSSDSLSSRSSASITALSL